MAIGAFDPVLTLKDGLFHVPIFRVLLRHFCLTIRRLVAIMTPEGTIVRVLPRVTISRNHARHRGIFGLCNQLRFTASARLNFPSLTSLSQPDAKDAEH